MGEQGNIKVIVRVRPYNRRELEQNQRSVVKVQDEFTLVFDPDEESDEFFYQGVRQNFRDVSKRVHKKLSMVFDRVYDTNAQNIQIHNEFTVSLVDRVLNGFNCSIFVYGATGAGKTFTMLGNGQTHGLTYLTMSTLFESMEMQRHEKKFDVGVTYLEVYNEQVMNLVDKTGPLKLLEDNEGGVKVNGLQMHAIKNAHECLQILISGNANRTQHPTDANAESSRSHAIFQLHVRITDRSTGTKRTSKFSMIDLAGSERASSTKGSGIRFKEGACINKSLLALGNCINKLADGLKHIPYRDSNLTRILKDSLGGNCQTLMIANISMSSLTFEDTYNTLKYASRAKKIRTQLKQNMVRSNMPKEYYVRKVNELSAQVEVMREFKKVSADMMSDTDVKMWQSRIDTVYMAILDAQEQLMEIKSKIKCMNLQIEILEKSHTLMLKSNLPQYDADENIKLRAHLRSQVEGLEAQLPHFTQKSKDAQQQLVRLEQERKDKNAKSLAIDTYLRMKEMQSSMIKYRLNNEHIQLLSTALIQSNERLRQALSVSLLLLTTQENMHIDDGDFEVLNNLVISQSAYYKKNANGLELPELVKPEKRPHEPEHETDDMKVAVKTARLSHHDVNSTFYVEPSSAVKENSSINYGRSKSIFNSPNKCDRTFALDSAQKQKHDMVNNLFTNDMLQVPANNEHLKSALIKSGKFPRMMIKENRRLSASRIYRSPHKVVAKTLKPYAPTLRNLKRKPLSSVKTQNNTQLPPAQQPQVRSNRAQQLRCKKDT